MYSNSSKLSNSTTDVNVAEAAKNKDIKINKNNKVKLLERE